MGATHIVLFQKKAPKEWVAKHRHDQKVINFEYITECYFRFMRIPLQKYQQQENDNYFIEKI